MSGAPLKAAPPPVPPIRRRVNAAAVQREATAESVLTAALSTPLHQRPTQGGDTMVDMLRGMFPLHDHNAIAVLNSVMDTLVQGKLDVFWRATIKSPLHAELLLFGLLPLLPLRQQYALLDIFPALLSRRLRNLDTCAALRLSDRIIWLLSQSPASFSDAMRPPLASPSSLSAVQSSQIARLTDLLANSRWIFGDRPAETGDAVSSDAEQTVSLVRRFLRLLSVLGSKSTPQDFALYMSPFTRRAARRGREAAFAGPPSLLLETLIRMAVWGSRVSTVFDFECSSDGILVTSMPPWPKGGITVGMWVYLEHPTQEAWQEANVTKGATLCRFRGADGVGMRLSVAGNTIVMTTFGEGGKEAVRSLLGRVFCLKNRLTRFELLTVVALQ